MSTEYVRLPSDLPKTLRSYGLKVTVVPGWRKRGRPAYTGGFNPVGVLVHHTATTVKWTIEAVLRLLTGGRTGLPGPLSQFGLSRRGRVYLIASGRANHAGWARSAGTVASGDGNYLYIGIEVFNSGLGEKYTRRQMRSLVLLCAILSVEVTGNSYMTVAGHKETSTTGKIDPLFDMDEFRDRVRVMMEQIDPSAEQLTSRGPRIDHAIEDLEGAKGNKKRLGIINQAKDLLLSLRRIK